MLHSDPTLFVVSAKQALKHKLEAAASPTAAVHTETSKSTTDRRMESPVTTTVATDESVVTPPVVDTSFGPGSAGQWGALERYVLRTLTAGHKVVLKLRSPLGVASHVLDHYAGETRGADRIAAHRTAQVSSPHATMCSPRTVVCCRVLRAIRPCFEKRWSRSHTAAALLPPQMTLLQAFKLQHANRIDNVLLEMLQR